MQALEASRDQEVDKIAAAQSTHAAALAEAKSAAQAEIETLRQQLAEADQDKKDALGSLEEKLKLAEAASQASSQEVEVSPDPRGLS